MSANGLICVVEFDPTQPVVEPVLREGSAVTGGAGEGVVLAYRPGERGQAHRAGVPEAAATGRSLLQNAVRRFVYQVGLPSIC